MWSICHNCLCLCWLGRNAYGLECSIILYVLQMVSPSFQFSLSLPESTWPMTTMLMWVFSLPMLRWYRCWKGSCHLEVKLETWEMESEPRPAGVLPPVRFWLVNTDYKGFSLAESGLQSLMPHQTGHGWIKENEKEGETRFGAVKILNLYLCMEPVFKFLLCK